MKKLFILLLVIGGGYSVFGSSGTGSPAPKDNLGFLIPSCLSGRTDIQLLKDYKARNSATEINLYALKLGTTYTWGQYLESLNPRLFTKRNTIIEILAPQPMIKDYVNTTGLSDAEQVADHIRKLIEQPGNILFGRNACCVYKAHPISCAEYTYDKVSLWDALQAIPYSESKRELRELIGQEDSRRDLQKLVISCLQNADISLLREFIEDEELEEGEFILDVWEKESSSRAVFARELKAFIKECGASFPNGHEVIKLLSADQTLNEAKVSKEWFLSANQKWLTQVDREGLIVASGAKEEPVKQPELEKGKSSLLKKVVVVTALSAIGYALYRYSNKARSVKEKQIA